MKKAFSLFTLLMIAVSATFAQTEATESGLTKQVVVTRQQPVQKTSTVGLYNGMMGTYITFRGHAPYRPIPQPDGMNEVEWPRFGFQIGAGQAYSFFTYEGVLEYMQTTYLDPNGSLIGYPNSLQGSARIGAMLPVQLGNTFVLIPNVKGLLGGNFSFYGGITSRFTAGLMCGLDFGFRLGGNKMITLGFVYEYRWYVYSMNTFGIDFLGGQLGIIL